MLITKRGLIAGPALAAVLAVTPASTVVAAPKAAVKSGSLNGYLSGVACPRANDCWAVGSQEPAGVHGVYTILIERWNGSRWRVATSSGAALKDAALSAVSCASTSSCWAVGAAALGTTKHEPITEHWNGRKWSLTVLAEPAGTTDAALFGVSCPTAARCWAAGAVNPGTRAAKALVEHWTGKRWSVVRAAAPVAGTILAAVSCRRDTNCWAVGNGAPNAPAEHWNGKKWSLATTPGTGGGLNAVSCPGTDCFAVGEDGFPGQLAERWNGSRWSVMRTQQASTFAAGFDGVSCITSSGCFAVGRSFKTHFGSESSRALVERLRGSAWVIVRSPNPAGAGLVFLNGVACTSARACWAVGEHAKNLSGAPTRTLAERWNGTRWSIVPTP